MLDCNSNNGKNRYSRVGYAEIHINLKSHLYKELNVNTANLYCNNSFKILKEELFKLYINYQATYIKQLEKFI